ncbi:alpha-1,4-N-acetylglucosaminyltransferase-like [Protopterus annectens]|uniref:alpha-1,4-N-acetylglucosaminyltransferase-like n=1 Tax=Protopterus annectens TaxID=7888 RepID=UPI001CFBF56E|nr:alpha-1,4-N-acetylglucosaminyltransferase-like [Protopterus annectens]
MRIIIKNNKKEMETVYNLIEHTNNNIIHDLFAIDTEKEKYFELLRKIEMKCKEVQARKSKKRERDVNEYRNNIHYPKLNIKKITLHYFISCLLQDKVYKEPYWIQTTSDGYRLVLLWKNGGFYFDTDVISTKKIPEENFLASVSSDSVANGVLGFQKHHSFIMDCMTDFVLHYNAGIWGNQGPTLITRMIKKSCPLPHYKKVQDFRCDARNLTFMHPSHFYPIHWTAWEKYFEVWKEIPTFEDSYGLHLYNYMNHKAKKMVVAGSNTLAENLFIKYCPSTYAFLIKKVKD